MLASIQEQILLSPNISDHNKQLYSTIIDDVKSRLRSLTKNNQYNDIWMWVDFIKQVIIRQNDFHKQSPIDTTYFSQILDEEDNKHPFLIFINKILFKASRVKFEYKLLLDYQVKTVIDLSSVINYLNKIHFVNLLQQRWKDRMIDHLKVLLTNIKFEQTTFDLISRLYNGDLCKIITSSNLSTCSSPYYVSYHLIEEYLTDDYYAASYFYQKGLFKRKYAEICKQIRNKDNWVEIMEGLYHIPSLPDPGDFYYLEDNNSGSYCDKAKFKYMSANAKKMLKAHTPIDFTKNGVITLKRPVIETIVPRTSKTVVYRTNVSNIPSNDDLSRESSIYFSSNRKTSKLFTGRFNKKDKMKIRGKRSTKRNKIKRYHKTDTYIDDISLQYNEEDEEDDDDDDDYYYNDDDYYHCRYDDDDYYDRDMYWYHDFD
jgi:hypothetical protein